MILGEISHFVVGREFAWPILEENHLEIHRILDDCWAFHGRIASREQVQIEISFPQHPDVTRPVPGVVGIRVSEAGTDSIVALAKEAMLNLHVRIERDGWAPPANLGRRGSYEDVICSPMKKTARLLLL